MVAAALLPGAISGVIDIAKQVLGQWIPDTKSRDEAAAAIALGLQQADLISLQGQIDINKIEAANPSLFVSGGRPALMWVCVCGIGVAVFMGFVVAPIAAAFGHQVPQPNDALMGWVVAMAGGLAGLRTTELWRGVAAEQHPASREAAIAAKAAGHPPVVVK